MYINRWYSVWFHFLLRSSPSGYSNLQQTIDKNKKQTICRSVGEALSVALARSPSVINLGNSKYNVCVFLFLCAIFCCCCQNSTYLPDIFAINSNMFIFFGLIFIHISLSAGFMPLTFADHQPYIKMEIYLYYINKRSRIAMHTHT